MKRFLVSTLILIGGAFVTFLPAEFWFFIYKMVGPVGFWEKAVIAGAGVWLCGGLQVVFLIYGGMMTVCVLTGYLDD